MKKLLITIVSLFALMAFTGGPVLKKGSPSEYRWSGLYSDSVVRGYIFNGSQVKFMPYIIGGLKAIDVAPGFNQTIILDQNHFPWQSNETTGALAGQCTRFDTDTTGAAFNDVGAIYSYFGAYFGRSLDSTKLWAFDTKDSYKWFDGTGARIYKPFVIWTAPGGKKIKKVACGQVAMILLTTGEVYERASGASSFTQVTLPGFCVDVASSQNNFRLLTIHDYLGGDSSQGYPYWMGTESGFVGDNSSRTSPFSLKTIWGLTMPIRAIVTNPNTYIFFDSAWHLMAGGDGAMGETGDGQEVVNKYTYTSPYSWTTLKGERYVVPPVRIASGVDWTNGRLSFVGNSFNFYNGASTAADTAYIWGKSKSFVSINLAANNESPYPNVFDRLTPIVFSPMRDSIAAYIDFALPKVHAGGPTLSVSTTSTTIGGTDTAAFAGPRGYSISSYQWTQKSGPNTATLGAATSASTSVSGLITGAYVFKKVMTDNNTGTWADSVTVNVGLNNGCTGCWIHHKSFKRKVIAQ